MTTDSKPTRDRWTEIVVPTAEALERFFWRLAWFTVIVLLLFGGLCLRSEKPSGKSHEQRSESPAR